MLNEFLQFSIFSNALGIVKFDFSPRSPCFCRLPIFYQIQLPRSWIIISKHEVKLEHFSNLKRVVKNWVSIPTKIHRIRLYSKNENENVSSIPVKSKSEIRVRKHKLFPKQSTYSKYGKRAITFTAGWDRNMHISTDKHRKFTRKIKLQ